MTSPLFSRQQYDSWMTVRDSDDCPFCTYTANQYVLYEAADWVWIAAKAPYQPYHTILVPKRHIEHFSQLSGREHREFDRLETTISSLYADTPLYWPDGQPIVNFMTFWRLRINLLDPLTQADKLSHLHIHFVPERQRSMDKIIDHDAHTIPLDPLLQAIEQYLPQLQNQPPGF